MKTQGFTGEPEKPSYTVTFDAASGTPVPSAQSVEEGGTATQPVNPAKGGYVFLYWTLKDASTAYSFNTPVTADITLTAKWLEDDGTIEYWNISWNLNGGAWPEGVTPSAKVVKGESLAEPNAPVKEGSTFEGWYKEAALTSKITFPCTVTADMTLYAKWTAEGGNTDPEGYKMFTSINEMAYWISSQPNNTVETPCKAGLKGLNLDADDNWAKLGRYIKNDAVPKYVDLYLKDCPASDIPDGYSESELIGFDLKYTYYGVFTGCKDLVSITLPQGIKTVGMYAFRECENLKTVVLPEGLEEIHEAAFRECTALSSVALPATLTSIERWGFYECSITSINLPPSLKSVGMQAFEYNDFTALTIPATLTGLSSSAFANNLNLTSAVIEEGVETVEPSMFWGCRALKTVTLPKSFKEIGQAMFRDCKALTTLTVPAGVTSVGDSAFDNAFTHGTLIMLPATPPALAWLPFEDASLDAIKVPAASLNAYKTAAGWKDYAGKIVANE
jgi:uncharacterized repeat protein (TIGR02543 family)